MTQGSGFGRAHIRKLAVVKLSLEKEPCSILVLSVLKLCQPRRALESARDFLTGWSRGCNSWLRTLPRGGGGGERERVKNG